jgi:hypothetical protein
MANPRVPRPPAGCHALLASSAASAIVILCALSAAAAPAIDCSAEVATLTREECELPRIEVASPADRPPYCITLETIIAFANRVKVHAARCPQSDHAPALAEWDKKRAEYSKLFGQYRCKRTR